MPNHSKTAPVLFGGLGLLAAVLALAGLICLGLAGAALIKAGPLAGSTATSTPTPRPSATPRPTRIPTRTPAPVTPTVTPTATPPMARVGVDQLRLRTEPSVRGEILLEMAAQTPLTLNGRTGDFVWLNVTTPDGQTGWALGQYVEVLVNWGDLPVISAPAESYIAGVTSHAREIYLQGQTLGNNPHAFSLVGDSNTDNPVFFAPFDYGNYTLGDYAYLQASLDFFKGSFARNSVAAVGSFNTSKVLDPQYAVGCQAGESPLVCEYRQHNPSIALILLGTGDQHSWQGFEARYRQIIDYTLAQGIIPVLITKADDLESKENTAAPGFTNGVIERLSGEYDIPLIHLRRAVENLPDHGCIWDGFHYNVPPDGRTTDFTGNHLQYGFTVRNLTALEMLEALRTQVLYDAPEAAQP